MDRRDLLRGLTGGAALVGTSHLWAGANDRIRVGVIGMGGRGGHLMTLSAKMRNVEVAAICDPDEARTRQWAASLEALTNRRPRAEADLRRLLEDKSIDAVIITCCNHWHGPAGIWGCQAGKHVYVEKPVAHNLFEGRKLVEASARYKRIVQAGTQNRSNVRMRKGIRLLHEGVIGDVYMARWLITGTRASIGFQQPESPPPGLHWDLWLGPASEQPFHRNLVHYNWHWFWDFGNGEMGNNGTHYLDVARWGLNRGFPNRIQATGGRFGYKDQAQTPNTHTTIYQYTDGAILQAEIRGVHTGEEAGWWFYGNDGSMQMLPNGEFRVYWLTNRSPDPVRSWSKEMDLGIEPGTTGDTGHLANFYSAIRMDAPESLRAPIQESHISCGMCLLGNIAYRVGRQLEFDPKTEKFIGAPDADMLLTREYRKPYVVSEKI